MEELTVLEQLTGIAENLTLIAFLLFAWQLERKRADSLFGIIAKDWERQREEEREKTP